MFLVAWLKPARLFAVAVAVAAYTITRQAEATQCLDFGSNVSRSERTRVSGPGRPLVQKAPPPNTGG
eukprot:gene3272-13296_t